MPKRKVKYCILESEKTNLQDLFEKISNENNIKVKNRLWNNLYDYIEELFDTVIKDYYKEK